MSRFSSHAAEGRLRELAKLLEDLLSDEELRQFVRFGPAGGAVSALLPERVSRSQLSAEVVQVLERRGEIDGQFFERLIDERPRREREIRAVARRFGETTRLDSSVIRGVVTARIGRMGGAIAVSLGVVICVGIGAMAWHDDPVPAAEVLVHGRDDMGLGPATRPTVVVPEVKEVVTTRPAEEEDLAGKDPKVEPPRKISLGRPLTEVEIMSALVPAQGMLRACAEEYVQKAGERIPQGRYQVRFAADVQRGLVVDARDLLSVKACVLNAVGGLKKISWRNGSEVTVDLYTLVGLEG